jgi:hypothetical protein
MSESCLVLQILGGWGDEKITASEEDGMGREADTRTETECEIKAGYAIWYDMLFDRYQIITSGCEMSTHHISSNELTSGREIAGTPATS